MGLLLSIIIICTTPSVDQAKAYLVDYFENNISASGCILDRSNNINNDIISLAATGFAFKVWAITTASSQPQVSRENALHRINRGFDFIIQHNPDSNRGILWHFYRSDGNIPIGTEASTIDTAIFYLGAQQAGYILEDPGLILKVNNQISHVDINWMIKDNYVRHGFYASGGRNRIDYFYNDYSEGVLIYRLFNLPYKPKMIRYDLPLFVYYYPLCFYEDPELIIHLKKAIEYQKKKYSYWGITAGFTEKNGYQAFEANTISPLTILTLSYYLDINDETTKRFAGLKESKDLLTGWETDDRLGIDDGACYILLSKLSKLSKLNKVK